MSKRVTAVARAERRHAPLDTILHLPLPSTPAIRTSKMTFAPPRPTFLARNLAVLNYAQGFTFWLYRHPGALAECEAPGFFNDATETLSHGDLIAIKSLTGTAIRQVEKAETGIWTR